LIFKALQTSDKPTCTVTDAYLPTRNKQRLPTAPFVSGKHFKCRVLTAVLFVCCLN